MRGLDTVVPMRPLGIFLCGLLFNLGCDSDDEVESESEEESVSQDVDPSEDPDSHPADVILSGAMGPMLLIGTAVAIPNFVEMQYRSKRSEIQININAIKTSLQAYDAEFDGYVSEPNLYPDSHPGKSLRDFPDGSSFDTLGWKPDGQVRGSYKIVTRGYRDFVVYGISDIDGDGERATFTATKTVNVRMITPNDVY